MTKDKWFLNGGRGSGRSFRLLCETYENKITELEKACEETQELLDKQIEATHKLDIENERLNKKYAEICEKVKKAKILLGRFLWDFNNDHYHIIRDEAEQFLNSEVEK
jgi:regulator of replication initiation timing